MSLLIVAFLAGILSVLAPCVLPVLPVILGGSLGAQKRYRPLVIVASTAICIVLFTMLLKVSTALINIPQQVWSTISAIIIIAYGLTLLRPTLRERVSASLWLSNTNRLADRAKRTTWMRWDILLWASLGPIFASCSPTYALLLSVVFPNSPLAGLGYTIVYAIWFALLLLVFAYGGRAIIKKSSWAANPNGRFKKWLGILLVITGILIVTWYMKKLEVGLLSGGAFDVGRIEQSLLENVALPWAPNNSWFSANQNAPVCANGMCVPQADNSNSPQPSRMVSPLDSNHPGKRYLNADASAPELESLTNWINSNPTSIEQLRGKVVIVDFWTYSCINCIRTLPYLQKRYERYADKWLVILGIHAPEFQFEKIPKNVEKAVKEYGLTYPIALDNDFSTRRAYNNRYRPAKYIIDKDGRVRYTHFGEWSYAETEEVIQYLLGLSTTDVMTGVGQPTKGRGVWSAFYSQTPETYLGGLRANTEQISESAESLKINQRSLGGLRSQQPEYQELTAASGSLSMLFYASEINLVMGNDDDVSRVEVLIDGKVIKTLDISENTLYNLWEWSIPWVHTLQLRVSGKGLQTYAFTFW